MWVQRKWSVCGGKGEIGASIKNGRDSIRENGEDENSSEGLEKSENEERKKRWKKEYALLQLLPYWGALLRLFTRGKYCN